MPELTKADVLHVCDAYANEAPSPGSATPTSSSGGLVDVDEAVEGSGLILPDQLLLRIRAALRQGNVRLIGPPGTGKSTLARAVLEAAVGEEGYVFTVATGQWTGEDIIGGPAPDPSDPTSLVFRPGLILEAAESGKWVGIDEMNRADIDAAFGELFGLLAGFDLELPYQPDPKSDSRVLIYAERPEGELPTGHYGLPPDWRMIATMNSWDKLSLNRVSFAFSRRWCTVFLPVPNPADFGTILDSMRDRYHPSLTAEVRSGLDYLFVTETDNDVPTLRELGFAMGPGIARSMLRDIAAMEPLGISPGEAFAHSVDGFLLPQFEGALEHHDSLRECLVKALGIAGATSELRQEIEGKLAVFTGQRLNTSY